MPKKKDGGLKAAATGNSKTSPVIQDSAQLLSRHLRDSRDCLYSTFERGVSHEELRKFDCLHRDFVNFVQIHQTSYGNFWSASKLYRDSVGRVLPLA